MKILLIEPNRAFLDDMATFFIRRKVITEKASNFKDGASLVNGFGYDFVIVESEIFKKENYQLVRKLKRQKPNVRIIVTAEHHKLEDKLAAFEFEIDDYLLRPFDLRELFARVTSMYRRGLQVESDKLVFRELRIDLRGQIAYLNNEVLALTVTEFELLVFLISNKNKILNKSYIAEQLWGNYTDLLDNHDFVYQHMKNLRKKLKAAGAEGYIKTAYGFGYRLVQED